MNDVNSVIVQGRLTRDPELKYTRSGTALCNLSVASNRSYKKNDEWIEETSFFDVVAWSAQAERVNKMAKGDGVVVVGSLRQETWEKDGQRRSKIKIHAEYVKSVEPTKPRAVAPATNDEFEDDIPF